MSPNNQTYKNKYIPKLTFQKLDEGSKFLEVPRACYQSNDFNKNDILVYSIILSSTNDIRTQYCYYTNQSIAEKLNLSDSTIERSISKLQKLGYIKIISKGNKREIHPLIDLRYNESDNKSVIRIYYRIFWYPNIKPLMIHIYSYYLSFSNMDKYKTSCDIALSTIMKSLNISYKSLLNALNEMESLKLIKIIRKDKTHIVSIKLLVDFSKVQVEEQKEINKIKSLMDKNFKDEMETIEDDTVNKFIEDTKDKSTENTIDESVEKPIEDTEDESTDDTIEDSDDSEYNDIFIDTSKPSRIKSGFEMEEGMGYNYEPSYYYEFEDDEIEF